MFPLPQSALQADVPQPMAHLVAPTYLVCSLASAVLQITLASARTLVQLYIGQALVQAASDVLFLVSDIRCWWKALQEVDSLAP